MAKLGQEKEKNQREERRFTMRDDKRRRMPLRSARADADHIRGIT
jgi:hypothetical protein